MGDISGAGVRDGVVRVSLGLVTSSSANTSTDLGMVREGSTETCTTHESQTLVLGGKERVFNKERVAGAVWGEVEVWSEGRMIRGEERSELATSDNAGPVDGHSPCQTLSFRAAGPCRLCDIYLSKKRVRGLFRKQEIRGRAVAKPRFHRLT